MSYENLSDMIKDGKTKQTHLHRTKYKNNTA